MNHSKEYVTPEIARTWLSKNIKNNRNRRNARSLAYAQDMLNGRWHDQGDPIRFTHDGQLIDGQHRLQAVVIAGELSNNEPLAIEMSIVRGLHPDVLLTIDTGVKRTFADVLKIMGHKDASNLATLVRQVAIWKAGGRDGTGASRSHMSHDYLYSVLQEHPYLEDAGLFTVRKMARCDLRLAVTATAGPWFAFHNLSEEDSADFFDRLHRGDDHKEGDPIYALRTRIIKLKDDPRLMSTRMYIALMCKAWNAYRAGALISSHGFRFTTGGASPEKFPEPI